MPRKKSVAESVEHLLKPNSLVQSDSEDECTVKISESLSNVNLKHRPSGILRKNAPLLHEIDKKYKGVVVSRKELDDEENSEEDDGETESDSEDNDELASDDEDEDAGDDSDGEDDPDDDENDLGINDFIKQFKSKVQSDVQEESGDDDEGDSEEDDQGSGSEQEEDDDNEDSQDAEEQSDEEEDEESDNIEEAESSMKILQPAHENPVQKGQAVRHQLDLWERILETRIKIQPVLNKANGFPPVDAFIDLRDSSQEFKILAKETQKNVANLLDNLIELQNTLITQFSETKSILKSGLYKRKFVGNIDQNVPEKKLCLEFQPGKEEAFKSYSNSVIQKWSDRTKVTNARNSKELLLNHNVLNQIEGVLLNKPDLIKNSQTIKGTYELFRKKKAGDEEEDDEEEDEQDSKWCPEVYDDTDFYHQMLRELIEYKSNSTTNPTEAARNYSELQKLKSKIKKQVDQKASKGRKIRYVLHKKLVSFMAPYSDSNWTEEAVQELFTSLFGNYHKSGRDVNESEPIEVVETEKGRETEMKIM